MYHQVVVTVNGERKDFGGTNKVEVFTEAINWLTQTRMDTWKERVAAEKVAAAEVAEHKAEVAAEKKAEAAEQKAEAVAERKAEREAERNR